MSVRGLIGPAILVTLAVLGAATGSLWWFTAALCWVALSLFAIVNA